MNVRSQLRSDELEGINSEECTIHTRNKTSSSVLKKLYNTLHTIVPATNGLLPQYRNPCWFMKNSKLHLSTAKHILKANISSPSIVSKMGSELFQADSQTLVCMPSVYFIGFPRSGSTQLYKMLLRHPQLQGGYNKEPHWWAKTKFNIDFPLNILSVVQYLMHFLGGSKQVLNEPNTLLIDGSQSTIWDTRTTSNPCVLPRLITSVVPTAKFIVLIRHPVERLFSDMMYLCEEAWKTNENKTSPLATNATDIFVRNAQFEIIEFERCLQRDNLASCTHHALSGYHSQLQERCGRVRLGISLYHVHIRRWLEIVPRKQFLFLRTDDLASNPLKVLERVWSFLEVPEQNKEELTDILHDHMHGTKQQAVKIRLEEKFNFLSKFFQSHNLQLAELLRDDNFSW